MRMGIGALAVTAQSCLPYKCGADPANISARYACAVAGYSGSLSCDDPQCQPYCPNQELSQFLTPPYQPPPTPSAPQPATTTLTPANIVQTFPDITRTLQPVITTPPCDWWGELNGAIQSNPLLAIAAASGLYLLFKRKK